MEEVVGVPKSVLSWWQCLEHPFTAPAPFENLQTLGRPQTNYEH
jgi:hypothetical protein